jgi:hypothetical protein
MKFIGKLILWLLVALLVILALISCCRPAGARSGQRWVTEYRLRTQFRQDDHRFSSPSHIILENVTFGRDGKPATLVAKKSISASAAAS